MVIMIGNIGTCFQADTPLTNSYQRNTFCVSSESIITTQPRSHNATHIVTGGPIAPFLNIAEVKLIDGPLVKSLLITLILTSRNIHFTLPWLKVHVQNLTFSIRYTKNIPDLPLIRRYSFGTMYKQNDNDTYSVVNVHHTVIVTGFTGKFSFTRAKPIRMFPAYFHFKGSFDEVIILI
jgi:hypothetical protein